ncbi:MAG: hypothetical protein AABM40_01505 [Chloroflexota bacterium]
MPDDRVSRCLHIDLEGFVKGHRFSYRAHIEVSGDESLDETVNDLIVEFRQNESWPLANQVWQQMTAAEDRALNQMFRNDVMSAYLMKRVRGELIDESFAGHPWKYDDERIAERTPCLASSAASLPRRLRDSGSAASSAGETGHYLNGRSEYGSTVLELLRGSQTLEPPILGVFSCADPRSRRA